MTIVLRGIDARWRLGEQIARNMVDKDHGEEIVGLGFPRGVEHTREEIALGIADDLFYVRLANIAPAHVRDKTFEIDGVEVQALLARMGMRPVTMWHSHTTEIGPSSTDLEVFPDWLVSLGVIYHIPTESTVLYTGNGIIHPVTGDGQTSFTTGDNE